MEERVKTKIRASAWAIILGLVIAMQQMIKAEAAVINTVPILASLNHLAVDRNGFVYLGAVNTLYRLNSGLSILQNVTTGPIQDNPYCEAPFDDTSMTCDGKRKTLTQNYNKVLVVDPAHGRLLTCGSVQQGSCQLRLLTNISDKTEYNMRDNQLAANDATSSTVAFLSRGPNNTTVIVSGITLTSPFDIRQYVPIIASRNLTGNGVLKFVHEDSFTFGGTFLKMAEQFKNYNITFVKGFGVGQFNYFLTVQQVVNEESIGLLGDFVTKIIRICKNDKTFVSYVEIPLGCGIYNLLQTASFGKPASTLARQYGVTTDDYILVGAFAEADAKTGILKFPYSSGICIYSFKEITERFRESIESCFRGPSRQSTIVKHIETEYLQCATNLAGIGGDICGTARLTNPINGFIQGNAPLTTSHVISYNSLITAVALSRIEQHTIAFLGTYNGTLKKVTLQRKGFLTSEYEEMNIDRQQPILKDMKFDPREEHLYVMTRNKVSKVQVSDCGRHSTCQSCVIDSNDPYCGWCSLERKCKQKSQCMSANRVNFWLPHTSEDCVTIRSIDPDRASVSTRIPVTVYVDKLPPGTAGDYMCVFNDQQVAVDIIDNTRMRCKMTPSATNLPRIDMDKDYITITLGIMSVRTGLIFIEKPFTFYNCSKHSSCKMCTEARWECNWCVNDNKCVSQAELCTIQTQTGRKNTQQSCPQLQLPTTPILVPVGIERIITLKGRNLPEPQGNQQGYTCIFHDPPVPKRVSADYVNENTIQCTSTKYDYNSQEAERKIKVEVVWNSNFYIDSPNDFNVTFYKCAVMGGDCSQCISLSDTKPQYECKWCGDTRGCVFPESPCMEYTVDNCPKPSLTKVMPVTGPLEGNTPVTISGSNLGTVREHVETAVTVAGEECRLIEYKVAKEIICETSRVQSNISGPIIVKINDASVTWPSEFIYQDPKLEKLTPNMGPVAGGSEVTISGKALDTGAEITVSLDSLKCNLTKKATASEITCLTSKATNPVSTSTVRVTFDGTEKVLRGASYQYVNNPNITDIYPTASFTSGGRILTVEGMMFDIIQTPKIFLFMNASTTSEEIDCQKINNTKLLCPTPNVTDILKLRRRRRAVGDSSLKIGFKMDEVTEVTDVEKYMPWVQSSSLMIYRNPFLRPFPDGKMIYTGGALVLEGDRLDSASTSSEVDVKIGKKDCEVETLSLTRLVCNPPTERPAAGEPTPDVVVTFGNAKYNLGRLEYQAEAGPLPLYVIVIIGVTGGVLVMIIIIILIVYQRKRTQSQRQFKRLQAQLDTLESNVRNECKQAFAELQTEVTDLTSDLNVTGIPFWDYKTYTFKVLFPSHSDHPVLHSKSEKTQKSAQVGLQRFNQLLNSKQFMVTFIRTLESQKNFNVRDKAVVASLLMIVIQDKMEYATEILKALLNELVDKSMEKKSPKLMLRRTESVVEKFLTNWLSICMYSFLKKHAGRPMFLLYKAIKHQSEKGLVDAITSDARYSLSEERLLRKKIDPNTLTLNLDVDHEAEMITCKVLDCDTITQAKEKCLDAIYKNTPCSKRPAAYDVDLRWHSGRSGFLPLQDEDVTTQVQEGWKQINTLVHYNVPDGATMTISPARDKSDMIRHQHGMVEISSGSPYGGIKPIVTIEGGNRVWHLVKPDDAHNQSRTQKVISEIFLTRLLLTKGTVQQYIDDLFLMILKVDHLLPPAIKYLFDLLDQAARRHSIVDQDVVHSWKSNSLPLRFWVNLIKNPEFVFDIRKSDIVDSCLSVIAQTFMDSCSSTENRLGKDSPSNKLLFARDIPKYKQWVERFYRDIREMPPISTREMQEAMIDLSMQNVTNFNVSYAVKELYRYALQYNVELLEALDQDSSARKLHLADKFEEITDMMDETPIF